MIAGCVREIKLSISGAFVFSNEYGHRSLDTTIRYGELRYSWDNDEVQKRRVGFLPFCCSVVTLSRPSCSPSNALESMEKMFSKNSEIFEIE